MKTKALLVAGLLFSAGAVSSLAQGTVFSVNAVGFVNVVCPPGYSIICNPLNAAVNTVSALLPNPPNGTQVFKFNAVSGSFTSSQFGGGEWSNPNLSLVPGEGWFIRNTTGTAFTNTFVGNVQQGTLVTPLNAGFTLVASQVPVSGAVDDANGLKLPIAPGDSIFTFENAGNRYIQKLFAGGEWSGDGLAPQVAVGQGFFIKKAIATSWTNQFSVNQ